MLAGWMNWNSEQDSKKNLRNQCLYFFPTPNQNHISFFPLGIDKVRLDCHIFLTRFDWRLFLLINQAPCLSRLSSFTFSLSHWAKLREYLNKSVSNSYQHLAHFLCLRNELQNAVNNKLCFYLRRNSLFSYPARNVNWVEQFIGWRWNNRNLFIQHSPPQHTEQSDFS